MRSTEPQLISTDLLYKLVITAPSAGTSRINACCAATGSLRSTLVVDDMSMATPKSGIDSPE